MKMKTQNKNNLNLLVKLDDVQDNEEKSAMHEYESGSNRAHATVGLLSQLIWSNLTTSRIMKRNRQCTNTNQAVTVRMILLVC
jgi:hypothetical protein